MLHVIIIPEKGLDYYGRDERRLTWEWSEAEAKTKTEAVGANGERGEA
jgi:hypothetical protein